MAVALVPALVQKIKDLWATGLDLPTISVEVEVDVDALHDWIVVLDLPGPLPDVHLEMDPDTGLEAGLGRGDFGDEPQGDEPQGEPADNREPVVDYIGEHIARGRMTLRRRILRGELDDDLRELWERESTGKARRSVLASISLRRAVLRGTEAGDNRKAWRRYLDAPFDGGPRV